MTLASTPEMIVAQRVFDGTQWLTDVAVRLDAGKIASVAPADRAIAAANAVVLPHGTILAPGLVDLQVNGGGGVLLNDAPSAATVQTMLRAHRTFGTTGFLPTLISSDFATLAALAAAAPAIAAIPGVLGLHLEGPFLNPARRGVHDAAVLRSPDARDLAAIEAIARVTRVLVTLAPECVPPGVIRRLVAIGVVVAIGHSDATAAEVDAAVGDGATGVTHLFNAMRQIGPREPGVVGAALDDARLISGLICDGIHVAPANVRLAFKALGRDRLALVSDAMPSVGAADPAFTLGGRRISLADGRLTTADGTLAGAHLGMIDAVRNVAALDGIPLEDALVMASRTPARLLGLDRSHGRIAPGFAADLVAFSPEFNVTATWIGGQRAADAGV